MAETPKPQPDHPGPHQAHALSERRRAWVAWTATVLLIGVLAARGALRALGDDYGEMDFKFFYDAALAFLGEMDIFRSGSAGYIYPPLLAVLFAPLALLGKGAAAAIWTGFSAVLLFASLWLLAREACRRFGLERGVRSPALIPSAMLLTGVVLADKIRALFWMGQTDAITLAGIAGGLAMLSSAPAFAGFLLGAAANIKYHTLIFLPYLLVRRRWRASAGFVVGAVGAALSTALAFGWTRNLEYLRTGFGGLVSLVGLDAGEPLEALNPITWYRSHAITSAAARATEQLGGGTALLVLFVAIVAGAALGVGWWLLRRRSFNLIAGEGVARRDAPGQELLLWEWAGLVVAALVFSPQTTGRHMVLLAALVVPACVLIFHPRRPEHRPLLIGAVAAGGVALVFPPGMDALEGLVNAWRAAGMASWVWLIAYFVILAVGLETARLRNGGIGEPTPTPE